MSGFPSLPPPPYSRGRVDMCSLLDSDAAAAKANKLEQWKEALHRSPHPTPLGLTKEDCDEVVLEEGDSEEGEGASAELDSDASFESTMYEDDEDDQLDQSPLGGRGAGNS